MDLPPELSSAKEAALRALGPIKPADAHSQAKKDFLFTAKKSPSSALLPPYYLVYFLLVDLLGFRNLGSFEKIAWSVPIDYMGKAFLIEDRKFGIGIFLDDEDKDEKAAKEIAIRIGKAAKAARPFFDWIAKKAAATSALNVTNNSSVLYQRYEYLRDTHFSKLREAELRKNEMVEVDENLPNTRICSAMFPTIRLEAEASALAFSAIEAFFSWSEHAFIHLAIILGKLTTGTQVANIANADWHAKFKAALDLKEPAVKAAFDQLSAMRKELRNYIAHGAFGKQGEAFSFHSRAGAVPVILPHNRTRNAFRLGSGLAFDSSLALKTIDEFVDLLWSGERAPARTYIEDTDLPLVLTFATDGTYANGMKSTASMLALVKQMTMQIERATNMDW